ncbi:hypothetical protein ACWCPS_06990 [Streptomyces mauvecolor]
MHASTREHANHTHPGGVPQQSVHKTDSGEVYLKKWHRTGPDAFRISTRRPERHAFHRTERPGDPRLFRETVRQPLSDHAVGHVPGVPLLETARRPARDRAGAGPANTLGPECELYRYFELGTVSAAATAPGTIPDRSRTGRAAPVHGDGRAYADALHLSGAGCPTH